MTKKLGLSIALVLVLVLGIVSVVAAQDTTPPAGTPQTTCPYNGTCPYGNAGGGMMGAGNGGMMGYRGTMPTLLADALGMTIEDLFAAVNAGQTVAQIAEAQGVELADVANALIAPRVEWLNQVVAAGTVTQEQADLMIATMREHMLQNLTTGTIFGGGMGGNGNGGCSMRGNGQNSSGGMRGRGRWNNATPQPQWNAPQS